MKDDSEKGVSSETMPDRGLPIEKQTDVVLIPRKWEKRYLHHCLQFRFH